MALSAKTKSIIIRTLVVGAFESMMYIIGESIAKEYGFALGIFIVFIANALIYLMISLQSEVER
jgi:hypothetical protein